MFWLDIKTFQVHVATICFIEMGRPSEDCLYLLFLLKYGDNMDSNELAISAMVSHHFCGEVNIISYDNGSRLFVWYCLCTYESWYFVYVITSFGIYLRLGR